MKNEVFHFCVFVCVCGHGEVYSLYLWVSLVFPPKRTVL